MLWEVLDEALDGELVGLDAEVAALGEALGHTLVDELDLDLQGLGDVHALEVDVEDEVAEDVALDLLEDGDLFLSVDAEVDEHGVRAEEQVELVLAHRDVRHLVVGLAVGQGAAVDDGGDAAFAAEAAGGAGVLLGPRAGLEGDRLHGARVSFQRVNCVEDNLLSMRLVFGKDKFGRVCESRE